MANKFWSKITGLKNDILEKDGEEVMVFYQEKKKKQSFKKEFPKQKREEKMFQEEWLPDSAQGQLVIDLYERTDVLVIKSAIAGAKTKDIDITVEPDLVVVKGEKLKDEDSGAGKYYYQECFWGKFSRTIILPCPIKPEQVRANFKNGILTIILPKAEEREKRVEIKE
ncbi:MAG: Hsp20/alpha crystallin family protein [Patescibacteria group bacterium]|jgi:HSP20 family protein|nr:Hsp20/alpha crystallin family protein [Patescibacteria group bacterium]MDD5172791.1 Hsp20/alpha crystallin family protein [Patescibacteria group bacterium]